ncbi:PDR/VanB family oxidoreductase [Methylobrevis pamukkalensis]|uniref:Phthalate dioxygenase reductase n=1 Tax=Methylobrevis pamukkalensis TaxID=1439726 RepID=A0A1E3H7A7_9HYPH|nr:PDR/VanB family oxidoreductase [Methylobrevis pamukkalensis]ODN71656.1 Phthalate dioxygenase reductase [Methylobrevis pamukkalensis]
MSSTARALAVTVADVIEVTPLVKRFEFVSTDGAPLPPFSGGAHVVVELPDGDHLRRNPYSLMSSPRDLSRYAISVRRDDGGRGGSRYLHEQVVPGMAMTISAPVNLFALDLRARKHLMIAGGIGITPFIAQIHQLSGGGAPFELHYKARSAPLAAYMDDLAARHPGAVHACCSDRGEDLDLDTLLTTQPLGTHLYVCGPERLIAGVTARAAALGWPARHVHVEHFAAPPPGLPFAVRLAASNLSITVRGEQSLLEAIEEAGVDAPYLCRGGACGQCETAVVACDGTLHHHDHWLTDAQRETGDRIMPCVSRFTGRLLTLDR